MLAQTRVAARRPGGRLTGLSLPVFTGKHLRAWPKHDDGGPATYRPAGIALRARYSTDAHTAAYSVERVPRRLDKTSPGYLLDGAPLVVRMGFLLVDVDGADHKADSAWREGEGAKVERALAELPGGFSYQTRGGYRLVWRLMAPFPIASDTDAAAWKLTYWRALLLLSRRFGIVGDPACADWTRLYRLPHATRDPGGSPEALPTTGDPELVAPLALDLNPTVLALDLAEARRLDALYPAVRGDDGKVRTAGPWGAAVRALAREAGEPEGEGAGAPPPWTPDSRASAPAGASRGGRPDREERERLWCERALDRMADELGRMVKGGRNNAARDAGLVLGHYAPHLLDPARIERALMAACERNGLVRDDGGRDGALVTIRRAISDGMAEPKRPDLPADEPRRGRSTHQTTDRTGPTMHSAARDQEHDDQEPASARRPANGNRDDRPEVCMGADLEGNVSAGVAALASRPEVYTRALTLAQIVNTADPEASDGKGGPVLRTLPRPTLREMLAASARWLRFDPRANEGKGGWKAALPTDAIVQGVEARGYWPELRPILGIAQTPFLRRDGSVCEVPGYDAASGFALVCREAFPTTPAAPTQADAAAALALILDLFCDFPFVDEAARHVPVAALLTMLAMPALGGANTPAFLFEANTPGTGKGLALDVVCILATGREVPKSPWSADDEMVKVLGAAALEGASILAFDNISPEIPFGGSAIELVLTCSGQYKPRILGRSESPTLPWRAVILGTGNNIVVRGDTRRRVLLSTQQTTLENPEQRDNFKYPHLRQEARSRRGELVCAALTILRAHALAGRPAAGVRRVGSFEEWGVTIASAIAWAGGANVADAMPRADTSDDPVLSALRVLLEAWPLFAPTGHGLRLGALADKLYPENARRSESTDEPADDGLGHVREALELLAPTRAGGRVRFDVRRLGMVLRAHRGRNLGGRAFKEGPVAHGSKTWVVVDPKTGVGVRRDGGPGGCGGPFTSDAGAPRAHAQAHTHAGGAPDEEEKSPKSPPSPTEGGEPAPSATPPPVSGVANAPDDGDEFEPEERYPAGVA